MRRFGLLLSLTRPRNCGDMVLSRYQLLRVIVRQPKFLIGSMGNQRASCYQFLATLLEFITSRRKLQSSGLADPGASRLANRSDTAVQHHLRHSSRAGEAIPVDSVRGIDCRQCLLRAGRESHTTAPMAHGFLSCSGDSVCYNRGRLL